MYGYFHNLTNSSLFSRPRKRTKSNIRASDRYHADPHADALTPGYCSCPRALQTLVLLHRVNALGHDLLAMTPHLTSCRMTVTSASKLPVDALPG